MSARRPIRLISALAVAGALVLAGCGDDGPSGPGVLEGDVMAPETSLGAVVLVIDGDGIDAVTGAGGTRAFAGPASGTTRRVVLVGGSAGTLRFDIEVEDVGASRPAVTVTSAVDTNNQDITALGEIDVRLSVR